jgi:Tfp pilus assembly protein PilV
MEEAMNCRLNNPGSRGWSDDTHPAARTTSLRSRPCQTAFSLLEVMIACGIFFMAVFAILAMVSSVLRNARSLRRTELDAGMVAAQACNTNKLTEGAASGDFGNLYPDYSWETETYEVQTNNLWQVDIVVRRRGIAQPVDSMSIYLYSPESKSGPGPTIR